MTWASRGTSRCLTRAVFGVVVSVAWHQLNQLSSCNRRICNYKLPEPTGSGFATWEAEGMDMNGSKQLWLCGQCGPTKFTRHIQIGYRSFCGYPRKKKECFGTKNGPNSVGWGWHRPWKAFGQAALCALVPGSAEWLALFRSKEDQSSA